MLVLLIINCNYVQIFLFCSAFDLAWKVMISILVWCWYLCFCWYILLIVSIGVGPWYWLLAVDFFDNHAALLARATGTVAEKRITGTVVLVILICLGILGTFERDPLPYILNWRFSTNIHQIIHYPPQIFWQPFSLILHKPRPYYNENINGREILTKNHW